MDLTNKINDFGENVRTDDVVNFSKFKIACSSSFAINSLLKILSYQLKIKPSQLTINALNDDIKNCNIFLNYLDQNSIPNGVHIFNKLKHLYSLYADTNNTIYLQEYYMYLFQNGLHYNKITNLMLNKIVEYFPIHLNFDTHIRLDKNIINPKLETLILHNYSHSLNAEIITNLKNIHLLYDIHVSTFTPIFKLPPSIQYINIEINQLFTTTINFVDLINLKKLKIVATSIEFDLRTQLPQSTKHLRFEVERYNYTLCFPNVDDININVRHTINDISLLHNAKTLILNTNILTLYNKTITSYMFANLEKLTITSNILNYWNKKITNTLISFKEFVNLKELTIKTKQMRITNDIFPNGLRKLTLNIYEYNEQLSNTAFKYLINLEYLNINMGKDYNYPFGEGLFPSNIKTLIIQNYNMMLNLSKKIFPKDLNTLYLYCILHNDDAQNDRNELYDIVKEHFFRNIPSNIETLKLTNEFDFPITLKILKRFKNLKYLDFDYDFNNTLYPFNKWRIENFDDPYGDSICIFNKNVSISPTIEKLRLSHLFASKLFLEKGYNLQELYFSNQELNPVLFIANNSYYYDILNEPKHNNGLVIKFSVNNYKYAMLVISMCLRRKNKRDLPDEIYRYIILDEFIKTSLFKNTTIFKEYFKPN